MGTAMTQENLLEAKLKAASVMEHKGQLSQCPLSLGKPHEKRMENYGNPYGKWMENPPFS